MTGLGQVGALGRLGSPALNNGGGDIIRSIFADGTDGFYFDFSKTDRLFQTITDTPADDAGENIYRGLESHSPLWGAKTLGQLVASQPEMVTNGALTVDASGWTAVNSPTLAFSTSTGVTITNAGTTYGLLYQALTTVVGRTYRLEVEIDFVGVGSARAEFQSSAPLIVNGSLINVSSGASEGLRSGYFVATATTTYVTIGNQNNNNSVGRFKNVSVKEIPGNHGLQATTSAQPKWQAGGLARFDGSDDALVTTLTPATAMTLMFKGKLKDIIGASVFYVMGSRVTAGNDRFYLGYDNSGRLTATIGGTALTRTGSLEATVGVGAVVLSGGVGKLYWNAVEGASGAVGTPNTTVPFAIGAINTSGTLSAFFKDDIYHALAIKKALPAAQIAAITNLWGTS